MYRGTSVVTRAVRSYGGRNAVECAYEGKITVTRERTLLQRKENLLEKAHVYKGKIKLTEVGT